MTAGAARAAEPGRASPALAGTWVLVRFVLRRDRVRLPAWLVGIGAMVAFLAVMLPDVYGTDAELQQAVGLYTGPVGRLMIGPAIGLEQVTVPRFLAGGYGLYLAMAAAIMSILLVVRHTRADEEAGRAELVRAGVVGRHAQLTATLVVLVVANVLVAAAVAVITAAQVDFAVHGSVLLGASIGAAGLAFGGLAALTAQASEQPRAAAGLAGAGLGVAFVVRGLGDVMEVGGGWLSWGSPLAWSQQTGPYVLDRWWPLALSLAFAALMAAVGYRLAARRDFGAGLTAGRPGRPGARAWLASAPALALRLQRGGLGWWAAALAVGGALFGAFAEEVAAVADDLTAEVLAVMGPPEAIVDGYLAVMGLFMALVVAVFALLAVQRLLAEETRGRADLVLATATSRAGWMGAHLAVTAVGAVALLAVAGLATGAAAAVVTGDAALVWDGTAAHLAAAPGTLLVLGLAAALHGLWPEAVRVAWAVPAAGLVLGMYGPLLDLPDWALRLSPWEWLAEVPLEAFEAAPAAAQGGLALLAAAVGLVGFRLRAVRAA